MAPGVHGHAAEPTVQTGWGAERGDDVWLISQIKADAKKETERKSWSRVCFSTTARKVPSRSRTAVSFLI